MPHRLKITSGDGEFPGAVDSWEQWFHQERWILVWVDPGSSESLVDPGIGGSWLRSVGPSSGQWIPVDPGSGGSHLR